MMGALFTLGMMSTVILQITFLFNYENCEKSKYPRVVALEHAFNGLFMLSCTLYFAYISKNWLWLALFGFCCHMIGLVLSFFLTESPRYLAKTGQIDKLHEAIETVSRRNSAKPISLSAVQGLMKSQTIISVHDLEGESSGNEISEKVREIHSK